MDIEKIKDDLNNCHKILSIVDHGSAYHDASHADCIEDLDPLEVKHLYSKVLDYTKEKFLEKYSALKPLLNGDLASIARTLPVHKNTFRNYIDGYPKDPGLMLQIIQALVKKAQENKEQILSV